MANRTRMPPRMSNDLTATATREAFGIEAAARRSACTGSLTAGSESLPAKRSPFLYQKNFAVIWKTRGLLLNVLVGLLNSGLLTVT